MIAPQRLETQTAYRRNRTRFSVSRTSEGDTRNATTRQGSYNLTKYVIMNLQISAKAQPHVAVGTVTSESLFSGSALVCQPFVTVGTANQERQERRLKAEIFVIQEP